MKIAHISDTHLGYAQYNLTERKKDFFKAFEKAIDTIIDKDINVVIHTGDMFESSQPDMLTLSFAIDQLYKLKRKGIEFVVITGNHDRTLRKGKIPPQRILKDLNLAVLIEPFGTFHIEGTVICGMQFMPKAFVEIIKQEKFPEFEEQAAKGSFSVFMFHQGISSYLPYPESFEMFVSDLPRGFDYYAGGHIHAFIKEKLEKGILSYSGSTEFRTAREASIKKASRGFNIIDTKTGELERVNLEGLRDFLVYNIKEENVDVSLEKVLKDVSNSQKPVVSIKYTFKKTPIDSFQEVLSEIRKQSLILKISSNRIENEEQSLKENISFEDIVRDYFKDHPTFVRELALEIAKTQPEYVMDILKNFAEEVTEQGWE